MWLHTNDVLQHDKVYIHEIVVFRVNCWGACLFCCIHPTLLLPISIDLVQNTYEFISTELTTLSALGKNKLYVKCTHKSAEAITKYSHTHAQKQATNNIHTHPRTDWTKR